MNLSFRFGQKTIAVGYIRLGADNHIKIRNNIFTRTVPIFIVDIFVGKNGYQLAVKNQNCDSRQFPKKTSIVLKGTDNVHILTVRASRFHIQVAQVSCLCAVCPRSPCTTLNKISKGLRRLHTTLT